MTLADLVIGCYEGNPPLALELAVELVVQLHLVRLLRCRRFGSGGQLEVGSLFL